MLERQTERQTETERQTVAGSLAEGLGARVRDIRRGRITLYI